MGNIFIGNQRIAILQGIEKNITLSEGMAQRCLQAVGHSVSLKSVNEILHWLEGRDLIKIDSSDGLIVASLTKHGQEIALGYAKEEGVDTPIKD